MKQAIARPGECRAERVCHPGLGGAQLAAAYDWGYSWEEETAALTDPALPGLLRERGISLGSFSK